MEAARTLDAPMKPRRTLTSVGDVIEALGGTGQVLELTGIGTYQQLSVCRSRGTLPAKYYLVMIEALRAKGFDASGALWGQSRATRSCSTEVRSR